MIALIGRDDVEISLNRAQLDVGDERSDRPRPVALTEKALTNDSQFLSLPESPCEIECEPLDPK
jgi:hypothetical protein